MTNMIVTNCAVVCLCIQTACVRHVRVDEQILTHLFTLFAVQCLTFRIHSVPNVHSWLSVMHLGELLVLFYT